MEQGAFLHALGLQARTEKLSARASPELAAQLRRAASRLADDAQMGKLFKVLAATSPELVALYPFGLT
jgi:SAM-dependent MidA family methyltransferase